MNSKNTKKRLVASVLAMAMCFTMLVGSTFAWFTDNAATTACTITSAHFELQLLDKDNKSLEGETLSMVDKDGNNAEFKIEPNGTYQFETVTIKNAGDVNLKYKVQITGLEGNAELLNVLTWEYIIDETAGVVNDTYEGHLAADETAELVIKVTMDKNANNDYMDKTLSGIAINVLATQDTGDFDSFDDQYDKLAEYAPLEGTDTPDTPDPDAPVVEDVGTLAELQAAFKEAANEATGDITINLTKNFDVANSWTAITPEGYNGSNNVIVNGNGFKIKNLNDSLFVGSFGGAGSITINDLTIESSNISGENYNNMGLGAFVTYSDSSGKIELNNCHLKDSVVTCTNGYAGGLVGYTSSAMTVTNCTVNNSTINGQKSVGAIIGHGGADVTVNGCEVSECTISETLEGRDSAGAAAVAGRMSDGYTLTLKGTITVKENTINQGAAAPNANNIYTALGTPVTDEATLVTE